MIWIAPRSSYYVKARSFPHLPHSLPLALPGVALELGSRCANSCGKRLIPKEDKNCFRHQTWGCLRRAACRGGPARLQGGGWASGGEAGAVASPEWTRFLIEVQLNYWGKVRRMSYLWLQDITEKWHCSFQFFPQPGQPTAVVLPPAEPLSCQHLPPEEKTLIHKSDFGSSILLQRM